MKKIFWIFTLSVILFSSCSDDDDTKEIEKSYDYSKILADYVDYTVIATYADMKNKSMLLLQATQSFLESSNQDDLHSACEYWKQTRKPWESSESFLYGPAASKSLDPLLDSWPLDQAQLDQVLEGNEEITPDYVRDALGAVLRGFHTIEYLLFREGEPRNASDITEREKQYMVAVTEVLRDDCITLWGSWAGVEAGSTEAAILEEIGVELDAPYGDVFKNAGNAGSLYLSQTDAVDEILGGIIDIADEVANAKIADPVSSGDVLEVESWFSWNSLTDFQNNIRSIQNSYQGGYDNGTSGASLSDYVAEQDKELDTKVKSIIENAISAIADIPEPFRNNLDNEEKVNATMNAVNAIVSVIEDEVRPLFVN